MIKLAKTVLYKTLDLQTYLKAMHVGFFTMYDLQLLKKDPAYSYHYFVKHLIRKGDCVVDIGANLGYYSRLFARLVGPEGKLVCVEPMPPFFKVLQWVFRNKKNVTLHNCALGEEDKTAKIFQSNADSSYFRTGLPNITTGEKPNAEGTTYEIAMRKGSTLLGDLSRIDYIKIDIEGYEEFVLPEIAPVIADRQPLMQIETFGPQRDVVFRVMEELAYTPYALYENKLLRDPGLHTGVVDYLFIPKGKHEAFVQQMKQLGFL